MIKLIATDIDGTLIQDSTPDLYPEIVEEIKRLTDMGVIFVGASGRQFASIRNVFREVEDRIVYIAENGAHIRYQGKNLALTEMRREHIEELMAELRQLKDCEIVVSTPEESLLESKNQEFIDMIEFGYRNKYRLVEDILAENVPILKIAVYHKGSIRELGESTLIPRWQDRLQTCVAGEEWVDFMAPGVDKGNALLTVQKHFGIMKSECMAFGDNTNDIGLMRAAGRSYAVENARPEVKEAAKFICPSWRDKGVWKVVKNVRRQAYGQENTLYITMLGGFQILFNGEEVSLDRSSASKPMQLLQILLLGGKQGIAREAIQEALYGVSPNVDRTNNLKQTIFRLRKMIEASILPEDDYIRIKKGRYYWQGELPVWLDAAEMKQQLSLANSESEEKYRVHYLLRACDLYKGAFLPRLTEKWAVREAERYKDMYTQCLREICSILKREKRYEELLQRCDFAARLYPNEGWDMEILDCLIGLERFAEAQEFYRKTSEHYTRNLGSVPSDELLERQVILQDRIRNSAGHIEEIQKKLCLSGENIQGAYYCSYPNFEGICHQMVRNRRDAAQRDTLLLCTMLHEKHGRPMEWEMLQAFSKKLYTAIQYNLRSGDCYTRFSENQFLILLVNCDMNNAVYAQKRIAYYLEKEYGMKDGVSYDMAPLR